MGSTTVERNPGDVLEGRYRLIDRVGQGGFGAVWRAAELLPDGEVLREVALKLLHAGLTEQQDWSAEARIIASLRHEALVTIYSAGVLDIEEKIPFVAMELLLGESLAERVEGGQCVPWRRVLSWARQAAAALDVIHQAGVVHLDLKPANLFLNREGALKVLDFGIAQQGQGRPATLLPPDGARLDDMSTAAFMVAHDEQPIIPTNGTANVTRSVVGTPGFMAPEVFEGAEATHAADAYALAACIVQLSTGRLPQQFTARPSTSAGTSIQAFFAEVQAATVRGNLRDLGDEHPELPERLLQLLMRWLSLDPLARGVERGSLRQQLDDVWARPHSTRKNPYRGLSSYGQADEGALYGRDDEVRRVARDLVDQPCTVLHGPHGAGLRSLVSAGVVPALARAFADGRDDWFSLTLHAGDRNSSPSEQLTRWLDEHDAPALSDVADAPVSSEPAEVVDDDSAITDANPVSRAAKPRERRDLALRRLLAWADKSDRGVVVVVPQLHRVADEAFNKWLVQLVDAAEVADAGVRLCATLREDHVSQLVETPLGERVRPWLRYVSPPAASAARDIVLGPLSGAGHVLRDAQRVAQRCQVELFADGARLPLVSLALQDWFASGTDDDERTLALWNERGGIVGAICRHADAVVEGMAEDDQSEATRLLLRLVSADGQPLAVRQELLTGDQPEALAALATLRGAHLIVSHEQRVQLSHPRIAEKWRWLVDKRLHDLERLTFLEQLRGATLQWTGGGYRDNDLWGADRLGAYRRRAADVDPDLTPDESKFVQASLKQRRLGLMWRALAGVALLAVVVGAFWFDHRLDERNRLHKERMQAAKRDAALAGMVARSRRTNDPYLRTALLAGAVQGGSRDPALPLELLRGVSPLVKADFLTLREVHRPQFPWGERWLLGVAGAEVMVFDFEPAGGEAFAPIVHRFQPHHGGLVDVVPLKFDNAFVSRGLDGELKVWRLNKDGAVALAAVSPMRCAAGTSQVLLAERAPVIACATEDGMARWDLRKPSKVQTDSFGGRLLEISPDGSWLVAARLSQVLLWNAQRGRRSEVRLADAANIARFSPRDEVVAFVHRGGLSLFDLTTSQPTEVFRAETLVTHPTDARFSDDGLNLAVCEYDGSGEWHYLRKGGRVADNPSPPVDIAPCAGNAKEWPKSLGDVRAYGKDISNKPLGPRQFKGGWQRSDGTTITHDLVKFDPKSLALSKLTTVTAERREPALADSVGALLHNGNEQVWQIGNAVRVHNQDGQELLRREGQLLARCPDGRLLAWRKTDAADIELFGVHSDTRLRRFKKMSGFVLGVDPECTRLFAQRLDGTLVSGLVAGDWKQVEPLQKVQVPGGAYVLDGYVYSVRPSKAGKGVKAGMWLAFGPGALVRVDSDGDLTAFGHATPRASALADGPELESLIVADATGVLVRHRGKADRQVLAHRRGRTWEDVMMTDNPRYAWVSWSDGVAVLDLERGELLDEVELRHHGRLSRWTDAGGIASWSFQFMGLPQATLIPVGGAAAAGLGGATSNLRATLSDDSHDVVISLQGR